MSKKTTKQALCVSKYDGTEEDFSDDKLTLSLKRSGASPNIITEVLRDIHGHFSGCVTTKQIYTYAYRLLKQKKRLVALQYNLRRAVMDLGPSGFPFEKFVGELLKRKGYVVKTNVMAKGWCVTYEIDVSARKDGVHHLIECKYHNQYGVKSDLKTALYVHARAMDIAKRHEHDRADKSRDHRAWLVTNTKLTTEAIKYCACADLDVVGWNYPRRGNLHDLIIETGVHPVTALSALTEAQKKELMKQGIVLCRQIYSKPDVVRALRLSASKYKILLQEVSDICEHTPK